MHSLKGFRSYSTRASPKSKSLAIADARAFTGKTGPPLQTFRCPVDMNVEAW
jgi:hypothetical protein